ncbi:TPA: hypothetical protein QIT17_001030 [Enterobacter kobei]|nr:hypothetical protein [Enterobacter kobei]HDT5464593.1 hypothetical protein [Enterobacter kobei]HEP0392895.1 hypothetical protein [Enterobacter kobei]
MKLIDILVQELPDLGGWPIGADGLYQNAKGHLIGVQGCIISPVDMEFGIVAEDLHRSVTREQYEAALAASKPEWNGDGLPPVGCECEHHSPSGMVTVVKIIAHFQNRAAMVAVFIPVEREFKTVDQAISDCFRPIRSEADKKRDEAIESIKAMLMYDYGDDPRLNDAVILYDAIAAGKIPHIRID